jgi:drug/metabolite transporter (DMT)-like permease
MGFIGVLVILRPGLIPLDVFGLAALASAVLFGGSSVLNRFLTRTEPASRIVLYTNILIASCGLIPFFIFLVVPSWDDVPLLLTVAITGTMAQYCLSRAMAVGEASFVGPFEFLRVPLAALAGLVVFAEFPNVWVWIGTGVVFVAIFLLTQSHRRGSRRVPVTSTRL